MYNETKQKLTITVHSSFFSQICSGKKIVEGRTLTPKFANLQEGDLLRIMDAGCESHDVNAEITRLTRYTSFQSMLETEGIENCLPGITSLEEGVKIYRKFPDYEAQEVKYGVLAIGIKIIKQDNPS